MVVQPVPRRSFVLLAAALEIPSLAVVGRFFGPGGVLLYLLLATFALGAALRLLPRWLAWLSTRAARGGLVVLLALVTLGVLLVYPLADAGIVGGSDSDQSLVQATEALLAGRHPYLERTYLGNPLTQMPGALLLAIPFVLLGNIALQNLVWLALYAWGLVRLLGDERRALGALGLTLALSPGLLHALAIGTDYVANSLFVLLPALWLLHQSATDRPGRRLGAALLLGLALSSRANFLLILPLLAAALARRSAPRHAAQALLPTLLTAALVTLPLLLYDPAAFAPLHTVSELGRFDAILPGAGWLIPGAALLLALLLGGRAATGTTAGFLSAAAVVQALPVLAGLLLTSLALGRPDFQFASFGIFFLFFGATAGWMGVLGRARGGALGE